MVQVVLAIHVLVTFFMIAIVLLQRSESGALGITGSGSAFMTSRQATNFLTRVTFFLSVAFMITSLTLAVIGKSNGMKNSILDQESGKASEVR